IRRLASRRGQPHNPVRAHHDVAVALQPLHRHGHRRRRNLKPMRQQRRNHLAPLGLSLQDGLQVVLFRNVDRVFHRGVAISLYGDAASFWLSPFALSREGTGDEPFPCTDIIIWKGTASKEKYSLSLHEALPC